MDSNARLIKYIELNPQLTDQNDKRNIKRARDDLEVAVTKNYNDLGIPCFAGMPVLDSRRGVVGFEMFALAGPIKDIFNVEETKTALLEALQESMVEILAKVKHLKNGNNVDPTQSGVGSDIIELAKPPKPVFLLNSKEMDIYFSQLKTSVALKDGIKLKRKWPKKVDGELIEATKIPSFDEFVEKVLPSNQYFGSSTKFAPGNLLWRLQLVSAYLLNKGSRQNKKG